jgi:hypothetical protein
MTAWKYTDTELKKILHRNYSDDETQSVANTIKELIPHLKSQKCYANLPQGIIKAFEKSKTFYTFNNALNFLYDYCDDNKIWTGFMPMD